ncbi:MAG: universal stress protein [Pirellulales bacterium]
MIKRILVGLAGTHYTPVAIEQSLCLAKVHNAELTGVTVLDPRRDRDLAGVVPPPWIDVEQVRSQREAVTKSRILESVRAFEEACAAAGVKHHVMEERGDPFTCLADMARYHDLVVFGVRSVFEFDFYGAAPESTIMQLVTAGVRPLIAVAREPRTISRVLIAYNGSVESSQAMKRFVQLGLYPAAELKIVTFHPSDDQAYELMRPAEEYCRSHGYRVCHESNPGDPKVLLLAAASLWKADLIVMGNSARNILVRCLLGDTLVSTLRETNIPLFLAQ